MTGGRGPWSAALALAVALGCGRQATPAAAQRNTMPTLSDHARSLPIGPADVHGAPAGQSPACNSCHYDKGTAQPSTTFRTFTCTGCHVAIRTNVFHDQEADLATFHATLSVADYASTVAGYAPTIASLNGGVGPQTAVDGACLHCHPTGMAVQHAAILTLPHQNAAATIVAVCADCHLDYSDRTRLGCAACHPHDSAATATAHAQVPEFVGATSTSTQAEVIAASALCLRCHADGKVPVTVAGHAGSTGFVLGTGSHVGINGGGCLDCHQAALAAKPFLEDFSKTTCGTACHGVVAVTVAGAHDDPVALGTFHANQGVDFTGTVASLGFDAACRSCHPDGSAGLPANHPFPVGATAPLHPLGACATCHSTLTDRSNPANFLCYTCHLGLDATLATKHSSPTIPVTDYSTAPARCLYCHGDAQVNRAADHPVGDGTPTANAAAHLTAGCANCHRIARTDKPFAADWSRTDCRGCHDTATGPSGN